MELDAIAKVSFTFQNYTCGKIKRNIYILIGFMQQVIIPKQLQTEFSLLHSHLGRHIDSGSVHAFFGCLIDSNTRWTLFNWVAVCS